ncbi:MAG: VWA domain-containing protein, partial [Prosthecobacter sp.]|nr:VWA domain-containing protein [Prosthecobacter sp.]
MFQHTEYLWFLFAVPLLAGLKLWMDARGQRVVREFTAPRLRESLIVGVSPWRSWLAMALYLLALVGFIVALAQPQWGEERLAVPERGRNIFIAIDTSRSMLARDVVPDRLTRAKLAVQDLVEQLPGERIGLLAVAGRSYLQAPLTTDHSAILESLQSFDHTIIEWGGSDLNDLMEVTLRAIKKLPSSNYALVIFSDGGDPDARLTEKIQQITKNKIVVVAVGVGTEAGAIIPDPEQPGDYVRDAQGNVVKTKLETGVLQQLASGTGGRFVKLGTQPLNKEVIQPILDRLKEQDSASRQKTKPIERFAWPLGAGIVLLMIAWLIRPSPPQRRTGFGLPIGASLLLLATVHPAATAAESPGQLAAYSKDSSDVSPAEAKAAFDHK